MPIFIIFIQYFLRDSNKLSHEQTVHLFHPFDNLFIDRKQSNLKSGDSSNKNDVSINLSNLIDDIRDITHLEWLDTKNKRIDLQT